MKIAVIAGGEWDVEWGRLELAKQYDILICADSGGDHAVSSGRIPDVLIGDFDSISDASLRICRENKTKIGKYPAQKDKTDLELALDYAEDYLKTYGNKEDRIMLYGAGGKRLDHLLGNVFLLLRLAQNGRRIVMLDKNYSAWVMLPGKETITGRIGGELSLIPLSEKAVINSAGLYYELDNLTLFQNSTRGISNIFSKERVELEILQGNVLVIVSNKNEK